MRRAVRGDDREISKTPKKNANRFSMFYLPPAPPLSHSFLIVSFLIAQCSPSADFVCLFLPLSLSPRTPHTLTLSVHFRCVRSFPLPRQSHSKCRNVLDIPWKAIICIVMAAYASIRFIKFWIINEQCALCICMEQIWRSCRYWQRV